MSQEVKPKFLENFSVRLKTLRKDRGLGQEDLAAKIGVSKGTVGNWETARNFPRHEQLLRLSEILDVSVGFLQYGEPAQPVIEASAEASSPMRKIPVVSWARAGEGGNFDDLANQIDEWLPSDCPDANAYALIIEGDSMAPNYLPGDRVIFLPNSEARNGDIVVARLIQTGDVYFKIFHRTGEAGEIVKLTSYNDRRYPELEFPLNAFRFIHPMYGFFRRGRR